MNDRIPRIPLHEHIVNALRSELRHAKPGARLDTVAGLAKRFGVSINTARDALLMLAREGLVKLKHGRGTFVAAPAAAQHVALWMTVGSQPPHTGYWSARIISDLQVRLIGQGIRAKAYWSVCEPAGQPSGVGIEEFLQDASRHAIAAVGIVQGPLGQPVKDLIRQQRIPVVGRASDADARALVVMTDQIGVMREGARRLLAQGCRRIAWLANGAPGQPGQPLADRWREAFRAALAEQGVPVRDHWIKGDLHPTWPGAGYEEFREIWAATAEKPDGLFVTDDVLLPDVVTAIQELGIAVPGQLKVVATAVKGNVTCPSFPAARMELDPGAVAAAMGEMLVRLLHRQPIAQRQTLVPFRWVESYSAAAAAGARPAVAGQRVLS